MVFNSFLNTYQSAGLSPLRQINPKQVNSKVFSLQNKNGKFRKKNQINLATCNSFGFGFSYNFSFSFGSVFSFSCSFRLVLGQLAMQSFMARTSWKSTLYNIFTARLTITRAAATAAAAVKKKVEPNKNKYKNK